MKSYWPPSIVSQTQPCNGEKIAMIIGQTEEKETKKKEMGKKKIWVDWAGSKSPNSFFPGGVYQPRAEGVMVFLFS